MHATSARRAFGLAAKQLSHVPDRCAGVSVAVYRYRLASSVCGIFGRRSGVTLRSPLEDGRAARLHLYTSSGAGCRADERRQRVRLVKKLLRSETKAQFQWRSPADRVRKPAAIERAMILSGNPAAPVQVWRWPRGLHLSDFPEYRRDRGKRGSRQPSISVTAEELPCPARAI